MFRPVRHHEPITCNVRHKHAMGLSTISYTTVGQSVNVQIGLWYRKGQKMFSQKF